VIEELRWPHGGHGDCASARAGYGVRRWPAAGRGARRRGDSLRRSASSAPTSCCQGYCQGWTAFLRFLRKQGSEGLHQQNEAVGNTGARALFSRWSEASLPVFQRGGEECPDLMCREPGTDRNARRRGQSMRQLRRGRWTKRGSTPTARAPPATGGLRGDSMKGRGQGGYSFYRRGDAADIDKHFK
jgi:hypothetical protein